MRLLAASAHAGFWAGALPLQIALQTYRFGVYVRSGVPLGLLVLFALTPPAVTLLARRPAWRPFLRVHGAAALTTVLLDPPRRELPAALGVFPWTAA